MDLYSFALIQCFLMLGLVVGWVAARRFDEYLDKESHHFDELFERNPHPELYNEKGKLHKGEYLTLNFDPGFDPDEMDDEELFEGG